MARRKQKTPGPRYVGKVVETSVFQFDKDVFIKNLSEATQDHVVSVDADGKLYKQDKGTVDSFTVEDGDTTDVVISNGKHWKFVEGGNININWTDTNNGTSSDEYDLTFTGASLQDLLISASHIIRGVAGADISIQSAQGIKFQVDNDESETPGTHTFDFVNGAGSIVATIDESGVPTFSIGAKGSSASSVIVDGGSGELKSRTLAEFKSDASLGNVENKSSATIRGEIVDSNIPALNASKVNAGTFDDARIPSLGASKVTSGTFDDARIPDLGASKVTSGTFADARIPDLGASKVTSGTFADARIPNLNVSKINAGTFDSDRVKQICTTHHCFTTVSGGSSSQDYWVPFIGVNEQASPNNTHRTVAPYSGVIKKVVVHADAAFGSSAQVRYHKINGGDTDDFANDNSTDDTTTNVTVDLSTAYTAATASFSSGNTFSAGDQVGISLVRNNTALANVAMTVVWEYTIS